MKKLLALLLALVMVLSFAACSNNEPADDQSNNSEESENTSSENNDQPEDTAASYKLGMGVVVSTASSKEGTAQVDATVAVVVLDSEGKIVKCELDCAQTALNTAEFPADLTAVEVRSKQEKKEDYGMAAIMNTREWYVQADAFAAAVVGMTGADVEAIETVVNDGGHNVAVDETLLAACTMDISAFKAAIVKACKDEYAKEFTADSFTLGLGVNTDVSSSKAASADANGVAALYTNFAGVVVAEDGTVLADLLDVIQPKVEFDATGAIVTVSADYDAAFKTKKELKEGYGMKGVSAIGLEWMEQATNFEAAVVGMTSEQITGIETVESNGHNVAADETLHASCSMDITEFQATLAKAFANAR